MARRGWARWRSAGRELTPAGSRVEGERLRARSATNGHPCWRCGLAGSPAHRLEEVLVQLPQAVPRPPDAPRLVRGRRVDVGDEEVLLVPPSADQDFPRGIHDVAVSVANAL